jgi:large subunit ribosomal protein L3
LIGVSKGKGFAGVVKRHGFHGQSATHGTKDQIRMPGSIGAGGVQRVFKGKRMGGRMGGDQVTLPSVNILEVNAEAGEILIEGAVPGVRGSLVEIYSKGELKVSKAPEVKEESKVESQKVESSEAQTEEVVATEVVTNPEEVTSAPAVEEAPVLSEAEGKEEKSE